MADTAAIPQPTDYHFQAFALGADKCVEVSVGDGLAGYAIFFSGGWDAWRIMDDRQQWLKKVGTNIYSLQEAIDRCTH